MPSHQDRVRRNYPPKPDRSETEPRDDREPAPSESHDDKGRREQESGAGRE
jgi:hypothetical protein